MLTHRSMKNLLVALAPLCALGASRPAAAAITTVEQVPVWRLQVLVQTCDVSDAGTDDDVYVQFKNDSTKKFYLDYGGDDFERNTSKVYDIGNISKVGVSKVSDITQLTIGKVGKDGLCLKSLQIRVNGSARPIFSHTFSSAQWIDGDDGHLPTYTFSSATLRANAYWTLSSNGAIVLPPFSVARAALESIIESNVGHYAQSNALYWGSFFSPRWVELSRVTSDATRHTAHVDLDLAYSLDYLPDPEVDVDFDLVLSCANSQLKIEARNIKVDVNYPTILDFLTLGLSWVATDIANSMIGSFANMTLLSTSVPLCPRSYQFTDFGDLAIQWL